MELTERQKKSVEEAPPLTAHQIAVIRGIFNPPIVPRPVKDDSAEETDEEEPQCKP